MPTRRSDPHSPCSVARERAPSDAPYPETAAVSIRAAAVALAVALAVACALAGCGDDAPTEPEVSAAAESSADVGPEVASTAEDAPTGAPAESGPPKRIFAKRFVVNIRSEPRHDAERLGYMRAGAVIRAKTAGPAHRDEGCPRGWFELSTGGFVCNGRDVVAFDGDRLPEGRALQPDLEADLPYQYGRVRTKAPLYRRLPTDEEAAQFEGYVIPGSAPPESAADGVASATPPADAAATPTATPNPAPETASAPAVVPTAAGATLASVASAPAPATEAVDPEIPTTLGTLMGENGSVVFRYLVPGFILSLDRVFRAGERRYYRTQNNGFVPYARIGPRRGSEFEGVVLEDGGPTLPLAFAVTRQVSGFERAENGRMRPSRSANLAYHGRVFVAGEEQDGRTAYVRTAEGRLYRADDLTVIRAQPRPADVPEGAQWVDIDLSNQTLVAYEGDRPVFATLISSGRVRRPGVEDLDHRTPTGTYRIRAKHITTTMDGDSAFDGPYSIEDVPYVMYFHGAYALHSAFWHDRFGHTKSHGCVNMAPRDARWLFNWAGPRLELGWHGAFPTGSNPAAYVVVRGETPIG